MPRRTGETQCPVRVLLVDDHSVMRDGLRLMLEGSGEFEVVGQAADGEEASEAGEQRVEGSHGAGKGFPAELVPSARDGDGDGVVCEK